MIASVRSQVFGTRSLVLRIEIVIVILESLPTL